MIKIGSLVLAVKNCTNYSQSTKETNIVSQNHSFELVIPQTEYFVEKKVDTGFLNKHITFSIPIHEKVKD